MDHMDIFLNQVVLQDCTATATDIFTAMYHTCSIQWVYSECKKWFHSYDTSCIEEIYTMLNYSY